MEARGAGRGGGRAVQAGRGGAPQPDVDGDLLPGRGVLDPRLQLLGQAHVDPGHRAVVGLADGRRGKGSGDVGGGVTTKLGSRPRSRSSTEPGARSLVISSAAADRASSSMSRTAESSGAMRRPASARASSPPASAATARSALSSDTYGVRSMAQLWHMFGTNASQ